MGGAICEQSPGPYWDGSDIADTLDASNASNASKQQAMPEKRRFQAVVEVTHSLSADGFDASEDGTGRGTPLVPVAFRAAGQDVFTPSSIRPPITGTDGGGAGVPTICFDSRQDPCEYGDRSGPLGVSSPQSMAIAFDTTQITSPGNYSNPQSGDPCHPLAAEAHVPAVAFIERGRKEGLNLEAQEDIAYALTNPGEGGRSPSRNVMTPKMAVRRLTPKECARLQSVPDDHFDGVLYHGKPLADGPKYKLLGNGFCVNVVNWIGQRIQMVEDQKESPCSP
jgi:DNA (cytosine-5)-methyltransferase 1